MQELLSNSGMHFNDLYYATTAAATVAVSVHHAIPGFLSLRGGRIMPH